MSNRGYDSSAPSSPFSLLSSLPMDTFYFRSGAVSEDEGSQFDDLGTSAMDSDIDWDIVNDSRASPSLSEMDYSDISLQSSYSASNESSSNESSMCPSPPSVAPPLRIPTPPVTPMPIESASATPPVLQLPVAHPSAQPFTLVKLTCLPQSWSMNNILRVLVESSKNRTFALNYTGRVSTPLWISFKPAFSDFDTQKFSSFEAGRAPERAQTPTQKDIDGLRGTALIRYLNAEDGASLQDMLEHMTQHLNELEEAQLEKWLWLLEIQVELVNDDAVEAGEEARGALLWVSDWLRQDDEDGMATRNSQESQLDQRTTLLVQPLPPAVRLEALVHLFTQNTAGTPAANGVTLLPHLSPHNIFMPCCVLTYADSQQAALAERSLSKTIYFPVGDDSATGMTGVYSFSAPSSRMAIYVVEYMLGDWSVCARAIQGATSWPPPPKPKTHGYDLESSYDRERTTDRPYTQDSFKIPSVSSYTPTPVFYRPQTVPEFGVHTCLLLLDLPDDIPLSEVVKVYRSAPIPPVSNAQITEEGAQEGFVATPDDGESTSLYTTPLPVRISLLKPTHPTYSPRGPMAILSFESTDAFTAGVHYLPTALWHLPGRPGAFVRGDERRGVESVYRAKYSHGCWTSLHSLRGCETWEAGQTA